MVIETEPVPFAEWLPAAGIYWVQVMGLLAVAALAFAFFVATLRNGPGRALEMMVAGVSAAVGDLLRISPRRVFALAGLAIREAIHRRVLVVFAVFILVLLFAGWFLDTANDNPARLYLSFVLTTTSYLVLLLSLFVSVFSLPSDINNRTIYTVVTKPVRPSELVLGRLIGFSTIGTAILVLTAIVSYFFVVRGLDHTHSIVGSRVAPISGDEGVTGYRGNTESTGNHRHQFVLNADGNGRTDVVNGHWHSISRDGDRYRVGPAEGMLQARVPIYGSLSFIDRSGAVSNKGVNVGEEWTYRSYIEGGTLATAVWHFQGVTPEKFPHGLPLELTIRIFRTHKGDIEKGVMGALILRNPQTGKTSAAKNFVAKEFTTGVLTISRKVNDAQGNQLDLFKDFAPNGDLDVQLQCLQHGQYFGMAQPDIYVRARDASFTRNFIKGYIGIWLQMLVLTAGGVMFSTFLNGAVAMLATMAAMIAGFFIPFMTQLAAGTMQGGGPAEALVRIVTRRNVTVPLEPGLSTTVIAMIDEVFGFVLRRVLTVLPDFSSLSHVDYVAYGFDVPFDTLLAHVLYSAAYLIPVFIAGFLFFRTREVAR